MANKVAGFLNEVKQELDKVAWPTRDELLGSTGVVIFTTLILAAFIGVVDFFLSIVLRILLG
ncbi:MAG: preprotein translocase subunit SecE [Omnitrophica bacterium GWA2_50_21]|nr:MAG: preprotein translocase subunit SecE [Omnitrophica bacterium GWA2_50_21]